MTSLYAIIRSIALCGAFFVCMSSAFAQNSLSILSPGSLTVADPRGAWNRQGQGRIEEALLTITPCGVYTKCDLFLTFSARGTALTSPKDSLEVQMNFSLLSDAHITDSWLWVGDSIVKAKIFDRTTASSVYETIVQRRKDPSLLTKNSPGYFNLRIFPMIGNETRKVKISYLIPNEWSAASVNALLPTSILKASSLPPDLNIIYYPDENWTTPRLSLQREVGFGVTTSNRLRETQELQTGRKVYTTKLLADEVRNNVAVAFTWENPAHNGVFVQTFRRGGEQFYHIAVVARQLLSVGQSDSVEIDNLRLSSSSGNCYDRYTLNLPPVYSSWYGGWGGISTGMATTRPAVNFSSTTTPFYTFRGTQRIDKNGVIQEVGRFSGEGGLTLRLGGYVNNVPFGIERTIPQSTMREGGDCSFQSWLGNHLVALENEPIRYGFNNGIDTAWQARQKRIVQLSVEHRVLSRLTAFLALEPNDTTRACNSCTQPSTGSPALAGTSAPSGMDVAAASARSSFSASSMTPAYLPYYAPFMLAVAPNPSNAAVTLTLTLLTPLGVDVASVHAGIYDALGRNIRVIPASVLASWFKQGQIHVLWDGDDDSGRKVAEGVYFLMVQTPTARQAVKIMRWN